jgi:inhibitor of KinA sporulation pathway (predicted exonuclease)
MRPYLVVDLEATCCDRRSIPRAETEIIEIGAVLVHPDSFAILDAFTTFVRPVLHPTLTAFCTQLTTITQADVGDAPRFPEALRQLERFAAARHPVFCSWGDYDWNQLQREATRHGTTVSFAQDRLNLKTRFAAVEGHRKRGLGSALARARLSFAGTAHRGIDDARNAARLLPFVLGREALPPV